MPLSNSVRELRDTLRGRVTLPGDPGWDVARRAWNLAVDQRPAAVIEVAAVEDVQAAVRLAARAGLRVAPQATGHGAEGLGPLDGTVLLKTSALRGVGADPARGIVRAGAGAVAGEVADVAGRQRLAPVLGLAATVGVAGLGLGGGLGWLSRAHGLTANNLRALEVVTAAGDLLRVDARSDPDLCWALRGGAGGFAIVTALELNAHPVGEVSAGMVAWPAEHAGEVLEQFRRWAAEAPESLGAVFRYLALPDVDAIPTPLRGRRIVAILAAHVGSESDGRLLMKPLRAARDVLLDTFGPIGPADLVHVAGDPERPTAARGDALMLDDLPSGAVEAIADLIVRDALAPLGAIELRLLGGALARAPEGAGALAKLDGAFTVSAVGPVLDAGAAAAIDARIDDLRARLAPWTTPRALLGMAAAGADPATGFDEATWERLQRVRDAYDPARVIRARHDVPLDEA
jgi:FAD/FMN-containing dehydrogenase